MTEQKYIFETFSFSGKSINCYGLEVVKNNAPENISFLPFDIESKNPILFSLYWPEQIFDFIKWRYNGKMKGRHIIVGGNTATANPAPLLGIDNISVFLGDGENFNIDGRYTVDRSSEKTEKSFSKQIAPVFYEDIQNNRVTFCEMSRGCRNKCLFCQYGWMKPYRESDIVDIEQIISRSKTKSIRMFAADRFQHKKYSSIRNILNKRGKNDTGSDVSIRFLLKHPEYLKFTNKVRIGVEGMSERLRRLIGKRYTDEDIVEFCVMVACEGIKTMDWYMIYGLPTEGENDVDNFVGLMEKLDEKMPKDYVICIHWNAFTPSAQTPFENERSAFEYDASHLRKKIFDTKKNKRIRFYHKPKLTSASTLAMRCIAIRATEECKNIIYHISTHKSDFLKRPDAYVKKFESITGFNPVGKFDGPMPWEKYVKYDKALMERFKNKNMERYGKIAT